jgi:uncharacterized protein (DUF433 family)
VAISAKAVQALTEEEWLSERINIAVRMLDHCVEIDSCKRGGIPVLRGTRFTVAQILAEIADGRDVGGLCTSFALDQNLVVELLQGFAIHLDHPFSPRINHVPT